MRTCPGALVISLDFELNWGVRDVIPLEKYRANLLGVREAVPAMLDLFEATKVHATWATVGFLFARSKAELLASLPDVRPTYDDPALSPYGSFDELGDDEASDPFHYAPSLIERIHGTPGQEIGSHTFSHYYCLERGQTATQFRADLLAAARLGSRLGPVTRSLVLPRNQWNPAYRSVLADVGVRSYRVSRSHWALAPAPMRGETLARRAVRLADSYLPVTGPTSTEWPSPGPLVQQVGGLFLRPVSRELRRLESVRLRRVGTEMVRAAREGRILHIWWHPHNFGVNLTQNIAFLASVLSCYEVARRKYGMRSLNMGEVAEGIGRVG